MVHPSNDIRGMKSKKLEGKIIILAVTGSIAAVETIKLARELIRNGAKVVPVMSESACKIIHPHALEFATGEKPITELSGKVEHILYCGEREKRADLLLIAPCTANTISKIALGIDDTSVTTFATTAVGSKMPIVVVPVMHSSMYDNPFVVDNIGKCMEEGITIVEPRMEEGKAKIAENDEIVETVIQILGKNDFRGKNILVIGGATSEFIDDVRVITNLSSGKMVLALAKIAYERGGNVEIWYSRLSPPAYVKSEEFVNHEDIVRLIKKGKKFDYVINCAAISDFTAEKKKGKIRSGKEIDLHFFPVQRINPLLRKIGKTLVGFKLEADEKNIVDSAFERMNNDGMDYIVTNTASAIGSDYMKAWIIDKEKNIVEIKGKKEVIAEKIFDCIL
ncbi:MAG: bifunctional phosphopantothenoylcysteine decarboxylase/phosphopantothenate--cysteine ligase CoaBC [Candidatus Thermoplasmatota archaeon]|nr:bifunctional phosphopantothenoylcysteine decarboxylase/phosphopantothenate--cysteine ligase CoaBC [Candidatus Thermoplasmatota archaeon]